MPIRQHWLHLGYDGLWSHTLTVISTVLDNIYQTDPQKNIYSPSLLSCQRHRSSIGVDFLSLRPSALLAARLSSLAARSMPSWQLALQVSRFSLGPQCASSMCSMGHLHAPVLSIGGSLRPYLDTISITSRSKSWGRKYGQLLQKTRKDEAIPNLYFVSFIPLHLSPWPLGSKTWSFHILRSDELFASLPLKLSLSFPSASAEPQ